MKACGALCWLFGVLSIFCGIFGAIGIEIWGIAQVIYSIIEMAQQDTNITFGQVFWCVAVWILRTFVAAITGFAGFVLGFFLTAIGTAMIHDS